MAHCNASNITETVAMDWLSSARSELLSSVRRQYLHNDYFAGGLSLMIIGFIVNLFHAHFHAFLSLFHQKKTGHVVCVKPEEEAFEWLEEWLSRQVNKDSLQVNLQTKWETGPEDEYSSTRDPETRPRLFFIPLLLEAQTISFQGQKVTFQLKRKAGPENAGNIGKSDGSDLASLLSSAGGKEQLVMEGPNREVLEVIIREAMALHFSPEEGNRKTCIRRWNGHNEYWNLLATKLARPMESVILDLDIENLLRDARAFLNSKKWYTERGIPHRRGYLLYGPPGCGKTSLIQVLAGELGYDVSLIGLSSKEMDDDMLHSAMCRGNPHSIVVLEDVDAVFSQRLDGEEKNNSLSFSGLLNAIDGISAQEGRLLVMTTNHLERLDPALIRPGRVDVRLFLGLATRSQSQRLFRRFYPQSSLEDANKFAEKIPQGTVSPATLQGYFLLHRESMEEAINCVDNLLEGILKNDNRLLKNDSSLESPGEDSDGQREYVDSIVGYEGGKGNEPVEEVVSENPSRKSKKKSVRARLTRALSLSF